MHYFLFFLIFFTKGYNDAAWKFCSVQKIDYTLSQCKIGKKYQLNKHIQTYNPSYHKSSKQQKTIKKNMIIFCNINSNECQTK